MKNTNEVFLTFLKLGLTSFGGPIAHLGYFRKELVERRQWVSEEQYGQLLAICQFLPGPASSQLGFTLGLIRAGWSGAFAAFIAFTLPSVLLLIVFASALPELTDETGKSIVQGLKLVAFAVVADAVFGMSKKLCPDIKRRLIALVSIIILLMFSSVWLQIATVFGGAVAGSMFLNESANQQNMKIKMPVSETSGLILFVIFILLLTLLPLIPYNNILLSIADAFYRAGALVFGGGHVVLPLLEESVVHSNWVSEQNFLAGYGAAQAIPGPLFSFSAYLGFVLSSDYNQWLTALTALLFMFLPGFLLVSAILPFWNKVSQLPIAANVIAGVNAAVVGILAAALYDPIFITAIKSIPDLIIAMIGFAMLSFWRLSPLLVVAWCILATLILTII